MPIPKHSVARNAKLDRDSPRNRRVFFVYWVDISAESAYLTYMRTSTVCTIIAFVAMNIHFTHTAWWGLLAAVIVGVWEERR